MRMLITHCRAIGILCMVIFLGYYSVAAPCKASTITEASFQVAAGTESVASVTASSPRASWETAGAEAAIATVYIDGHYDQDIAVDHGSKLFTYHIFLGPLRPGKHLLSVMRNTRWSAPRAPLDVRKISVHSVSSSDPEYAALAHAPILYARADSLGHFSDVPLVAWYEIFPNSDGKEIQYSFIFSNEDAGTPTAALMARWGRTTDIEYAYRVWLSRSGKIQRETFQGFNHRNTPFRGKKDGEHPYLLVATPNNVFADTGASEIQYHMLPVCADLSHHSREELMDRFPWTYRIMAEELKREKKLLAFGEWSPSKISNPRNYLYLELKSHNQNAGLMAWVEIKGSETLYSSDGGHLGLAIWRSGWFRTTVELPPGTTENSIQDVGLQCIAPPYVSARGIPAESRSQAPQCQVQQVSKMFMLGPDYRPEKNILATHSEMTLKPGMIYMLTPTGRAQRLHHNRARQGKAYFQ